MFESFLITSRETLEVSLVVGIVFSYLYKTKQQNYNKIVYWGIFAGILASIFFAVFFHVIAGGFEGTLEQVFEGTTMILAAILISTMILWMLKQKKVIQGIEQKVEKYVNQSKLTKAGIYGLFFLVLISVLREGVETVLFLNAISFTSGINFIGGILGVLIAMGVGYLFFTKAKKLNLSKVFNISSILLILFAAGLIAHGVHEFEEAGIINPIIYPVWDINPAVNVDGTYPALHEKGSVGSFFKGLFGYNGNPSLVEVISYISYLILIYLFYRKVKGPTTSKA
jgi:high-affinity iron transporter